MKPPYVLTLLFVAISTIAFAQVDARFNYTYSQPKREMAVFANQAHGINMQALFLIPKTPIALGADIGYNLYGMQTSRQTYRFSDGSSTETNVNVSNNFATFNLVGRVDLLQSGSIIPYLMGQTGYNLYWTNLNIADPEDTDGCKPLENKALLKDGALSVAGGGGVRIDLGGIFKSMEKKRLYADFSAQYTQGGQVSFMNVKIPPQPTDGSHAHHSATNDAQPYNAQFINPTNQVVHEHHVGDVYTTPIQLMSYKVGIVYRFTPCR